MTQLPVPSTIETQPRNVTFLTKKTVVRKIQKNDGQTDSCAWTRQCLDGGGGVRTKGCTVKAGLRQAQTKCRHNVIPSSRCLVPALSRRNTAQSKF